MTPPIRQRWPLPICSRCGGILAFPLHGGCTCKPFHAKTGTNITAMPVAELEEIARELDHRAERGFSPQARGAFADAAEVVREHLEGD